MAFWCKSEHTITTDNSLADQLVASTMKDSEWGWNGWMTCLSKTEWKQKGLQVGCAASWHHSVSKVYTEQKFQGCPCQ